METDAPPLNCDETLIASIFFWLPDPLAIALASGYIFENGKEGIYSTEREAPNQPRWSRDDLQRLYMHSAGQRLLAAIFSKIMCRNILQYSVR